MNFLQPWAVWFLCGVPVIVLLYFLRHKRRTVSVSTHLFWQRALQETSRRALFRRLRHVLSLLLHLLIYGLIVGALARPSFRQELPSGASTVIVLDARARMQATEPGGETRFARALAQARSQARRASERRQTALVILEANAAVAVPFVADSKPLLAALEHASPCDATGDAAGALHLAEGLLASRRGGKEIIWVSDRAWMGPPPAAGVLANLPVGTARDNVAITRFATRPLPASPETSEVLLEVQNFGAAAVKTEVELSFDGQPLEVKPFALGPGERRPEIFSSLPRPGRNARGWLTAHLTAADALAVDNTAYALLPPIRPARVLLISAGNPFLEKFLSVDPSVKYQVLAPEAWKPELAPKFEAVIFDKTVPGDFDLAKATGNFLFLKTTPFGAGVPLEQPVVTDVDLAHPTTRQVSLKNVSILHAVGLDVPAPRDGWTFTAPLRSFDRALLITGERPGQRLAALTFDVLESDLPLRVAFPLLMSNTLHWLSGEQAEPRNSIVAGETVALAEGERASAGPLTVAPRGSLPAGLITQALQPLHNGYYTVTSGDTTRWLAVNTFSTEESDLRGAGGGAANPAEVSVPVLGNVAPWQWMSLVALGLFTLEWWMFHRRRTE